MKLGSTLGRVCGREVGSGCWVRGIRRARFFFVIWDCRSGLVRSPRIIGHSHPPTLVPTSCSATNSAVRTQIFFAEKELRTRGTRWRASWSSGVATRSRHRASLMNSTASSLQIHGFFVVACLHQRFTSTRKVAMTSVHVPQECVEPDSRTCL